MELIICVAMIVLMLLLEIFGRIKGLTPESQKNMKRIFWACFTLLAMSVTISLAMHIARLN